MASRIAMRSLSTTARRFQQSQQAQQAQSSDALKQETKRNPELLVRPPPPPEEEEDMCEYGMGC